MYKVVQLGMGMKAQGQYLSEEDHLNRLMREGWILVSVTNQGKAYLFRHEEEKGQLQVVEKPPMEKVTLKRKPPNGDAKETPKATPKEIP